MKLFDSATVRLIICLFAGLAIVPGCIIGQGSHEIVPESTAGKGVKTGGPDPDQKPTKSGSVTLSGSTGVAWTEPNTGMEFVRIPGGCFQMGNPDYLKVEGANEGPVHEVCLDEFYLGRYEVTVGQFSKFSGATGHKKELSPNDVCYVVSGDKWSRLKWKNWRKHNFFQRDNEPVVCLKWDEAQDFARWLSGQAAGGGSYRLPTEAEWEYAARTGSDKTRFWGDNGDEACGYANVHDVTSKRVNLFDWSEYDCDDAFARTAPVGSFTPNDIGLYDMLGNVWEYTRDWFDSEYYSTSPGKNPPGPAAGKFRVIRGGGWGNDANYVSFSYRSKIGGSSGYDYVGFRLVFLPGREGNNKGASGGD